MSQLTRSSVQAVAYEDTGDDTDQGTSDSATPMFNQTWRDYPFEPREMMIIGSFGDHKNWHLQKLATNFNYYIMYYLLL